MPASDPEMRKGPAKKTRNPRLGAEESEAQTKSVSKQGQKAI